MLYRTYELVIAIMPVTATIKKLVMCFLLTVSDESKTREKSDIPGEIDIRITGSGWCCPGKLCSKNVTVFVLQFEITLAVIKLITCVCMVTLL